MFASRPLIYPPYADLAVYEKSEYTEDSISAGKAEPRHVELTG
jgi:hypothetical protein